MPSLADLQNQRARITVEHVGLAIWVDYAVQAYTFDLQSEVEKYRAEKEFDRLVTILCRLILAWDITDAAGQYVPVNPDTMRTTVGLPLALKVYRAIEADMFDPNPGSSSANGSAPSVDVPGSSAPAPSGTASSATPVSTESTPPTSSASPAPVGVFVG